MHRAVQFSKLIKSQSYRWLLSNELMMCTWYIPLDLLCQLLLMQTKQLLIPHVWSADQLCIHGLKRASCSQYQFVVIKKVWTPQQAAGDRQMDRQTDRQLDSMTDWRAGVIVIWPFMCMFAYGHPSFGSQFDLILNKKPFFQHNWICHC